MVWAVTTTSTGSRLDIGPAKSGRNKGSIYGSPGGSGPLIRAALLVLAVVVLLVLVARNCTGSDGTSEQGFEESVRAGVATIDPDIEVTFGPAGAVTLTGTVGSQQESLEAAAQAVLAGAEDVDNQLTVVEGATQTADPAAVGGLQGSIDQIITASPIVFPSGSAELTEEATATLDELAQLIAATPGASVDVIGHTDNQGDPAANLELSRQRALAVRNHLVTSGIDVLLVNSEGRGDAEPVADNDTEEGRAANRRIEFVVR